MTCLRSTVVSESVSKGRRQTRSICERAYRDGEGDTQPSKGNEPGLERNMKWGLSLFFIHR